MRTLYPNLVKALRHQPTAAEEKLWQHLRNRQLAGDKFRRQQSFGPYILDFYCAEKKLAIELDGDLHGAPGQSADDRERDAFLLRNGLTVLRFWNQQVAQEFESVLETIYRTLQGIPLTRTLSPGGEREPERSAATGRAARITLSPGGEREPERQIYEGKIHA